VRFETSAVSNSSGYKYAILLVVSILASVITGCSGSRNVPAEGHVSFTDQSPVRSGKVELRSADSSMRAIGNIDAEGKFSLRTDDARDGVPPGDYEAVVVQFIVTEDMSASMHGHGGSVPRRYADYYTSGLKVSIPEEGNRDIKIVVEPK
jgi:hypothetical protein